MHQTVRVNPTWSKGYARKGAALHGARRWNEAIEAYEEGLKLDGESANPALVKGLKEVQEAQSKHRFGILYPGTCKLCYEL